MMLGFIKGWGLPISPAVQETNWMRVFQHGNPRRENSDRIFYVWLLSWQVVHHVHSIFIVFLFNICWHMLTIWSICNNIYKCWDVKPYQSQENKIFQNFVSPSRCILNVHPVLAENKKKHIENCRYQVPLAQTEIRPSAPPLQMYLPDSHKALLLWDDIVWGARVTIRSINLTWGPSKIQAEKWVSFWEGFSIPKMSSKRWQFQ